VSRASPQCSGYITGEILPVIGGYGGRSPPRPSRSLLQGGVPVLVSKQTSLGG
jgi:hypothetical protein